MRSSGVCEKGSLGTKARIASSSSTTWFAFARSVSADVLARHPRTGRARAAMIGDAAHDTDGVPALPARRWEERTARRSSRRVGDALGATHARAPAPTVNARVARTRTGAAAEKEAHVNMSGRCREDAPSGARDFQSARAADQATFRLVMDDARRASTGPTARSLVGGVVRTASCAPECASPHAKTSTESVMAGHVHPTAATNASSEFTAVSPRPMLFVRERRAVRRTHTSARSRLARRVVSSYRRKARDRGGSRRDITPNSHRDPSRASTKHARGGLTFEIARRG